MSKLIFADSFESGDFKAWSYAQGADPAQGGPGSKYCFVTSSDATKMLAHNNSDNHYAHFQRPAGLPNSPHAKVYKEWTTIGKKDQFGRIEDPIFNNGDVSALYSAWYYFPTDYIAGDDWVNIFQFKEQGQNAQGIFSQNPSWWVNVGSGNAWNMGPKGFLFVNNQGNDYKNYSPILIPLPLGRWFQISALLTQGNAIDWYLDGKQIDMSHNSVYPVGRSYHTSNGWIFGVGHYGGVGAIYIDDVTVTA